MSKPTYNSKKFLHPESERTMACYHAKVTEEGIMKLTIHDCKGSIQLHNDLNDPEQIAEALNKLGTLLQGIYYLQNFIANNYTSTTITLNSWYNQ
jgi:hypothetical protein